MGLVEEHKNEEGQLHREDGPAIIREISSGIESEWYLHGVKHRVGGPAIESPNYTEYWLEGQLHRDGGPSVVYHVGDEDGNGVGQELFHLHGVIVSKELAESKDEDFDRLWFLTEENVEVRREVIRKFGMERIFKLVDRSRDELEVGEALVLDTEGDYELWDGRLTEETYGVYLKMKNPSIGVWHLEGVIPDCKTVEDAIRWRNGGIETRPDILT